MNACTMHHAVIKKHNWNSLQMIKNIFQGVHHITKIEINFLKVKILYKLIREPMKHFNMQLRHCLVKFILAWQMSL